MDTTAHSTDNVSTGNNEPSLSTRKTKRASDDIAVGKRRVPLANINGLEANPSSTSDQHLLGLSLQEYAGPRTRRRSQQTPLVSNICPTSSSTQHNEKSAEPSDANPSLLRVPTLCTVPIILDDNSNNSNSTNQNLIPDSAPASRDPSPDPCPSLGEPLGSDDEASVSFPDPAALHLESRTAGPSSSQESLDLGSVHSQVHNNTTPLTENTVNGPVAQLPLVSADAFGLRPYSLEIFRYMKALEAKLRPKHKYMQRQKDINHSMRTILVDWLVEVADEYRLTTQTLHTTVCYIDRFLSEMAVQRGKLQLVGITCMLLASKYEEIHPPTVDDFVYITDNTYLRDQVLKMEHLVLKVLKFDMGSPTALGFAEHYLLSLAAKDDRLSFLTRYLVDLSLQDGENFLKYSPSLVAAASLCTALHILRLPSWSEEIALVCGYAPLDLSSCSFDLHNAYISIVSSPQHAVKDKYSHPLYLRVATLPPPAIPPFA